ncbi:Ribosomal protein S5, N-terminal [Dillenia turbinata]|uniref:Small ribosomal subunit protein uS5c n=1 Tax=Dillenia turbinata TaxID=194707 RepID=A0AAN8ULC0_9MAGN
MWVTSAPQNWKTPKRSPPWLLLQQPHSPLSLPLKFSLLSAVSANPRTPFLSITPDPGTLFLSPLSPLSNPKNPSKIRANSSDFETTFFDEQNQEVEIPFEPIEPPEGFVPPPSFDEGPSETEDEIAAAYEELYGPAYSGVSVLGNDIYVMDKVKKTSGFGKEREKVRDGFEERVVQVRRVTKVVKGGKQLKFRAIVVVGDKQGQVGVGVGKAKEVIAAVQKSATNARRNIISVPMTKYSTFPHRPAGSPETSGGMEQIQDKILVFMSYKWVQCTNSGPGSILILAEMLDTYPVSITCLMGHHQFNGLELKLCTRSDGDYGAAKVMLRPASPGTGVIAGGAVRIVLEMAGVENALGKQLGSNNALNNARATVVAIQKMRQFRDVARERGIPMEELWK